MLQVQHVSKIYQTGDLIQKALDDVTINLRDNEFVAILGPSGSGKTTFLNVVGGLDRYDSGNLIINGVSTQEYTDRDWDAYRNHTVGFVFQSYNLISHQTILSNVELALTISGVDRKERRERALAALDRVGLADQAQKLPAQLSGGQMQRVAIARALINDPEIVLADEPTGALDSDTSLQVMNLLQEVAKDRLVVLVTHNPELAETYATRIIRLQDGAICADSDPYEPEENLSQAEEHKLPGKASMSLWTSAVLSFNNLLTKKARTILTAIAGSIGIIGIALILAISSGVNRYIDDMEVDMVKEYPIEVENSYYDVSAFVSARSGDLLTTLGMSVGEEAAEVRQDVMDITALIYNILSGQASNDLLALREFIESNGDDILDYTTSVEYDFGITPLIYQDNTERVVQVHPDHFFDVLGFGSTTSANSIMSSLVSTDAFFEMPEDESLYRDDYTVLAGRWPESYNECILVMSAGGGTTDIGLYMTGLRDMTEMEDMIDQFVDGEVVEQPQIDEIYTYDDFLGINFKVINSTDLYEYDSQYDVWTDKSDDEAYMQKLVDNGENLTIVGIVDLKEGEDSGILNSGFNYMPSLVTHLVDEAAQSEIVKQQLANPDINVFTNKPFDEEDSSEGLDLTTLFDVDEDSFQDIFQFDEDMLGDLLTGSTSDLAGAFDLEEELGMLDLASLVDLSSIGLSLPDIDLNLNELMSSIHITASEEELTELGEKLLQGYQEYSAGNPQADISQIGNAFTAYLQTSGAQQILLKNVSEIIRSSGGIKVSTASIESLYDSLRNGFIAYAGTNFTNITDLDSAIRGYLGTAGAQSIMDSWSNSNISTDLSNVTITEAQMQTLTSELVSGYESYAASSSSVPDPAKIGSYFSAYLNTAGAQQIMTESLSEMISMDGLEEQIEDAIQSYAQSAVSSISGSLGSDIESQISGAASQLTGQIEEQIEDSMTGVMSQVSDALGEAMDIDPEALLDVVKIDMEAEDLLDLLSSFYSSGSDTLKSNLEALDYTDFTTPDDILIYPKDFSAKEKITEILDNYNARMEEAGEADKMVSYTDSMGSIMSLVTEIVQILSYVLIAFVAISLVVSCIMIGVITYISVLERKKEIGILRAIGASKRNISQVFNAETAIIGLAAGILGIVVTLLLIIPINILLHRFLGIADLRAYLPFWYAVILIVISVVLTLLSGMIPSTKAARSNPVDALRSE